MDNEKIIDYWNRIYPGLLSYIKGRIPGFQTEDFLQDLFILVFTRKEISEYTYDHFRFWLFGSLKWIIPKWYNYYNGKKNIKMDSMAFDDILDTYLHQERIECLYAAMETLPLKYKEIIHLHYFKKYTFREIGFIKKQTTDAVKSINKRALKMLKCLIKKE